MHQIILIITEINYFEQYREVKMGKLKTADALLMAVPGAVLVGKFS